MEEIVRKMLALGRFDHMGVRGAEARASADLGQCIRQAEEQFRSFAELRGVGVSLRLEEPLLAALPPDEAALLVSNLLLNSLQHSGRGSLVTVSGRREGDRVEMVVRDHGEGIDPADLPHVFERFYRGDPSRNRSTGGTGLGLSISKAIVEAANGEIHLASEVGVGTTVTVRLPPAQTGPEATAGEFAASAILPSA